MAQYQSFPDAAGDSRTLDKMKALRLPDLAGHTFLDVGCNEGFFCGFAKFQGAERAVGIDHSGLFIERAKRRFPTCEFYCQGWDSLPQGTFDVILLASALHYAQDQPALIHKLMQQVAPEGVLVLELGIFSAARSDWVTVKRGIDERLFPTMSKLKEVLADYAWKWMGPSVSQDGDPVARHVIHISRRRPLAYLLMQPPAHGKTSIARHLFEPARVEVVSGDQQLNLLAQGKVQGPSALAQAVRDGYSPFHIDQLIQRLLANALGEQLVTFWASSAAGREFALDAYVPAEWHGTVKSVLRKLGYLPVMLCWDRSDLGLLPGTDGTERANEFYRSLDAGKESVAAAPRQQARQSLTGHVDEISVIGAKMVIRGWAMTSDQQLPSSLEVSLDGRPLRVELFEKTLRADVQAHMGLAHAQVGYRLQVDISSCGIAPAGPVVVSAGGSPDSILPLGRDVDRRWKFGR